MHLFPTAYTENKQNYTEDHLIQYTNDRLWYEMDCANDN